MARELATTWSASAIAAVERPRDNGGPWHFARAGMLKFGSLLSATYLPSEWTCSFVYRSARRRRCPETTQRSLFTRLNLAVKREAAVRVSGETPVATKRRQARA